MNEETTKVLRINYKLFKRLDKRRESYESWSSFFNRMIPEEKRKE